jgi:uncharacterized membrane protein
MADINPYQAPQADVADPSSGEEALANNPKSVTAGRGVAWIVEGWALFRQAPAIWIAITVIAGAGFIVLSLIPILGQIASPLLSVLVGGGIMLGCRGLDRGEPLTVAHLVAGFQSHLNPLLVIGALYLAGMFAIIIIASVFTGGAAFALWRGSPDAGVAVTSILLIVLVVMLLMIPLVMAIWFAPALATLHNVEPVQALRLSFRGCLRNILPFLVYGVVAFVLAIIASIPFGLGWLVLLPVLAGSVYVSYRDIFLD